MYIEKPYYMNTTATNIHATDARTYKLWFLFYIYNQTILPHKFGKNILFIPVGHNYKKLKQNIKI